MSTDSDATRVWTDADFSAMAWHDCPIHALGFIAGPQPWLHRVWLDIDYISGWLHSDQPGQQLGFRLVPSTLVFLGVTTIHGQLDLDTRLPPKIDAIEKTARDVESTAGDSAGFVWSIRGHEFEVRLQAQGFRQYARSAPVLSFTQHLEAISRPEMNLVDLIDTD